MNGEVSAINSDQVNAWQGPLHFVGIGGYGMSGLAMVMSSLGVEVSGCDLRESDRVKHLRNQEIKVALGHSEQHLHGVRGLIYSTDVPTDNIELQAARRQDIPVMHRSDCLSHVFRTFGHSIAVSGTHGKTSTSAMMGEILKAACKDPTVVIGGELPEVGFTARIGDSDYLVAEACESDGSFVRYNPRYAIATNLEPEHLEFYDGNFQKQIDAFEKFLQGIQPGGVAVINNDDRLLSQMDIPNDVQKITCSMSGCSFADYGARNIDLRNSVFELWHNKKRLGEIELGVLGKHMVSNALQVSALAHELELPFSSLQRGLKKYGGVKRRFQRLGQFCGVEVIDDYAHHPTEVAATLRTARQITENKLWAVFQPQRHTRTQALMDEFSQCFSEADELILTPIYSPPGQVPIPGVSSAVLADRIEKESGIMAELIGDKAEIVNALVGRTSPGDVVLVMGAGDIWKVARQLVKESVKAAQN